jgi:hypothetical protein
MPWKMRINTGLTRRVIDRLCPRSAAVVTRYGGTAGPLRPGNAHRHAYQIVKRGTHLGRKVDRVVFRGRILDRWLQRREPPPIRVPYLTGEFRSFLDPAAMYSRDMYGAQGLAGLLSGSDNAWYERESMIAKIATVEQLCRELDFRPGPGFLAKDMRARAR